MPTIPRLPLNLGRYRLLEKLGQGGYGAVFQAELRGPVGYREMVAVKVLGPEDVAGERDPLLALADEAVILRSLRHPHIVQMRSFEDVQGPDGIWHVLALEYVDGVTLADLLLLSRHTGRPLPRDGVLNCLEQALDALAHAHAATDTEGNPLRLVHRDLKPANLMVDVHGDLRMLDFGIAWAEDRRVRTRMGETKGSLPYMSPEQLRGEPVDGRSDLYVLGAIFFELLCGLPWVHGPGPGRGLHEVARDMAVVNWIEAERRWTERTSRGSDWALPRSARKGLAGVLGALLDSDVNKRFATAEEAKDALVRSSARWDRLAGRKALGALARKVGRARRGSAEAVSGEFQDLGGTRPMPAQTTVDTPAPIEDESLDSGPLDVAADFDEPEESFVDDRPRPETAVELDEETLRLPPMEDDEEEFVFYGDDEEEEPTALDRSVADSSSGLSALDVPEPEAVFTSTPSGRRPAYGRFTPGEPLPAVVRIAAPESRPPPRPGKRRGSDPAADTVEWDD